MGRKRLKRKRGRLGRILEDAQVGVFMGAVRVLSALPSRWVLNLSDFVAGVMWLVDRKGRNVARQNLTAVFGENLDPARRREILRGSYRGGVRAILLLLHLHPMTPEKLRRWVDVPEDAYDDARFQQMHEKGAILVSGHIGNWELLLGMSLLFPTLPPMVFVAEVVPHDAVNRLLEGLRAHGDLIGAMRKGGSRIVLNNVRSGGTAALLADRNVRGIHGGLFVPFLGLPARTTPLPSWLALRNEVPLFPIFCFPTEGDRYRVWLGPDLTQGIEDPHAPAAQYELTLRINNAISDVIRARPELWNWRLKRFRGRPDPELGDYPPYSRHDPDSERRAGAAP